MISAGELQRRWRELPMGSLDEVIGSGTCLILAPHPDDESLGCGGLIAACCAAGRAPIVVILTDGSGSHPGSREYPKARLIALRAGEAARAVAILGLPNEQLMFLHQPDTEAPHAGPAFDAIVDLLADYAAVFGCSSILAPWRGDPHGDHVAAALIGSAAAHIARVRHVAYPVWGWTIPATETVEAADTQGWRLDVTPYLAAKQHALAAHASQYGGVITDDPKAFQLPRGLLEAFAVPYEVFLLP